MKFPTIPYDLLQSVFDKYSINTPLRKAWFMANCHHETTDTKTGEGFKVFEENLNYKVELLLKTFSRKRISEFDAKLYGRTTAQKANKKAIANCIYGGEWGKKNLGNTQPNDGWFFRGAGAIQLTGRSNQVAYFKSKNMQINPDLLQTLEYALDSAGWFWEKYGLNELADKNNSVKIREKINGGTLGLDKCETLFDFYYKYFKNEN